MPYKKHVDGYDPTRDILHAAPENSKKKEYRIGNAKSPKPKGNSRMPNAGRRRKRTIRGA